MDTFTIPIVECWTTKPNTKHWATVVGFATVRFTSVLPKDIDMEVVCNSADRAPVVSGGFGTGFVSLVR